MEFAPPGAGGAACMRVAEQVKASSEIECASFFCHASGTTMPWPAWTATEIDSRQRQMKARRVRIDMVLQLTEVTPSRCRGTRTGKPESKFRWLLPVLSCLRVNLAYRAI